MTNKTNVKVPKKYQSMIELIEYEEENEGYWLYSNEGYIIGSTGCHTSSVDTQKQLLEEIRTIYKEV